VKLNLGCGWDRRDGYLNIDFVTEHHPDLAGDVLNLPLRSGIADEVHAQDVLEHLGRTSTEDAIKEWHRVTKAGGVARIRVPSLFHAVDIMRRAGTIDVHRTLLQNLYGTQAYTGDVHLTCFTDLTIAHAFHDAGYRELVAELVDTWLWDITAVAANGAPVAVFFGDGLSGAEGTAGASWRWSDQSCEVALINTGPESAKADVSFLVQAEHEPSGTIDVRIGDERYALQSRSTFSESIVLAPQSRTVIEMTARFGRFDVPQDPRSLYFQIVNPNVSVG
jgi:hypothetical protein